MAVNVWLVTLRYYANKRKILFDIKQFNFFFSFALLCDITPCANFPL